MLKLKIKNKKENLGITLIALVVTIIILIILVSVVINLTLGSNGIFNRAQIAKNKMAIAAAKEEIELALTNEEIKAQTGENLGNMFIYSSVWDDLRQKDEELQVLEKEDNLYEITYKKFKFKIDEKNNVIYLENVKAVEITEEPSELDQIEPEPTSYIIKYYKNDGTDVYEEQEVEMGQETTLGNDRYVRGGYIITGWYQNAECTGNKIIKVSNNIELYAKWEEQAELISKGVTTKDGITYNDSYEIWNKSQLQRFRDQVDVGNEYVNTLILQKADIDLNPGKWTSTTGEKDIITTFNNAEQWNPIGESDYSYSTNTHQNTKSFKGTYDGNNKEIKGLYINDTSSDVTGLFAYSDGIIKNITLKNSSIKGRYNVGGIVSFNKGTIQNCKNYADLSGLDGVGGICSSSWSRETDNDKINNCYNYGKLYSYDGLNNRYFGIGGIVGNSSDNILGCGNYGTITLNSKLPAGGIIGYAGWAEIKISESFNHGDISISCTDANTSMGGIVGEGGTEFKVRIERCYNKGKVDARNSKMQPAGIISWGTYIEIEDCYNAGEVYANGETYTAGIIAWMDCNNSYIKNTYNIGNIINSVTKKTGSLYGYDDKSYLTVTRCYVLNTTFPYAVGFDNEGWGTMTNQWPGCLETKNSTDMKNLVTETTNLLSSNWKIDTQNINNGYPILSWQ